MKKFLIALSAVVLLSSQAEARDFRHQGGHGGHGGRPVREVVVVQNNHHRHHQSHGCGCGYSYTYASQPVRYVATYPAASSVYFSNRNFAFGLSNFLW